MRILRRERVGLRKWLLPLMALALLIPGPAAAGQDDLDKDQESLAEALKKGKATVDLRYRLEQVSDDVPAVSDDDAIASTLRTTLAYQTSRWQGLSGYVQFEDVSNLGASKLHNDTQNGIVERPLIADPKGTELQQAYLRYTLDSKVEVSAGRVEFLFDDERFIGPVGWRQNHQSFDVAMVSVLSIPKTKLTYVYVDNVNTVVGSN
ncbi:MAG: alginate export family protein, partial [Acidobacteria bacterium]|nr:alginate export family protein [Acidobacteriota bacterium]